MKVKATLKQIAKELNVSVSTVSKALNDSPEISDLTKVKIKEYAKLKNYKPNVIGLNLKNRKTKTIGVIIPNILNSFYAKVFSGIEKVADKQGYNVITCISNESIVKEVNTLEMLSNGTIDGFILSVSEEAQKLEDYSHFSTIINEGTPIVMFDRIADGIDCDKVIVDDFDSGLNVTQRLIKLGCKNIALISSIENLSVGKLRTEGYLRVAVTKGYKVPEDISIVGFADGILASRRLSPSLSTVSQHGVEIGEVAAKLLIDRLENEDEIEPPYETVVIKTKLKERESSRTKKKKK
jgi:LacI family transcriptional regulator